MISGITLLLNSMNVADSTDNHPVQDGKYYGYGSWQEALEWLGEPDNLSQ